MHDDISVQRAPEPTLELLSVLHTSCRGVATVGIIIGFVIFGALVLAVLNMSSTSQLKAVSTNLSQRAYYLAESGFRIAAAYYLNTGDVSGNDIIDDDKAGVLKNYLDGQTFTVSDKGSVTLSIYPYWMISTVETGTNRVAAFPGQLPPDMSIPSSGKLMIIDSSDPTNDPFDFDYTGGSLNGTTFTYTVSPTVPDIPSDSESLYFFLNPVSNNGTISHDSNLILSMFNGYTPEMFPKYQGLFQLRTTSLEPELYTYKKAQYDAAAHRLTLFKIRKVSDPDNSGSWSASLDQSTDVIFKKFIILESNGQSGTEERTLRFYTPIQDSRPLPPDVTAVPTTKAQWEQTFSIDSDVSAWDVRSLQSSGGVSDIYAELQTVASSSGTTGSGGNDFKHGTFWYNDRAKINDFWIFGGNRLAYDVQAKVGTGNGLPCLAAGLSFRARGSALNNPDSYLGVSFMRYSAPTVYFESGGQIGSPARDIAPGDTVEIWWEAGQSGNWMKRGTGVVLGTPMLSSGSYAGHNARGALRLAYLTPEHGQSPGIRKDDTLYVGGQIFAQVLDRNDAFQDEYNDLIPDAIKPKYADFSPGDAGYNSRFEIGPLLLVLWERNGSSWNWLAYKDISTDTHVRGMQDWDEDNPPPYGSCTSNCPGNDGQVINDKASLVLQVREKRDSINGTLIKYNEINVCFGDSSQRWTANRPGNDISYDLMDGRKRYLSAGNGVSYFPTWPPQRLPFWNQSIDFYSHVEQPSVSGTPQPQFHWDAVNPNYGGTLLSVMDDGTIRTSELPTYEPPAQIQYLQHEVGMHGFGNIVQNPFGSVAFVDFALRFVFENAKLYGGFLEPYVL